MSDDGLPRRADGLPRRAVVIVNLAMGAGVIVTAISAIALIRTARPDGFVLTVFAVFTAQVGLTWVRPILMYRDNESEAVHLDEGFLVLMLLLLPDPWTVMAFSLAIAAAQIIRRRPLIRTMFNWGQVVASVGLGAAVRTLVATPSPDLGVAQVGAAALGALVFALANRFSMAAIVAALGSPWRTALFEGLTLQLRLFGASITLGVIFALAISDSRWSLAAVVVALLILRQILAGHFQSHHDRSRLRGLLAAALEANSRLREGDVVAPILGSARSLLRCTDARLEPTAPQPPQLGAEISVNGNPLWLVMSGRGSSEPFDAADVELLHALAAVGTGALTNAALYQEIRAQGERLSAITTSVGEGVCALDEHGRLTFVNPAAAQMLGRELEAAGTTEAPAFLREAARAVMDSGELVRNDDAIFWRPDGTSFPVELTASALIKDQGPIGSVIVFRDTSERQELEMTRSRLVAFLDGSPDLVALSDRDEHVSYVNPAGRTMLGLTPTETLTSYAYSDFYPPSWNNAMSANVASIAAHTGVWRGESVIVDRSGCELPVHQVVVAHYGGDGAVDFFSTTARDITEVRRLQDDLHQSQKLQALGQLAGGVAHDFNNVLAVISLCGELLAESVDNRSLGFVTEIQTAARRAAALTDQLLTFSRRQHFDVGPVYPVEVIIAMQHMLSRLIGENIQVTTTVSGAESCCVEVDRGRLEQVIMNLFINGRDAMPDGGSLSITVERVDAEAPDLPGPAAGGYVKISVSDTGTGITADTQAHVFEPFFTTKPRGEGTGLGLATVHGIVAHSGGHITVTSRLGEGSTFIVYLPLLTSLAPAAPVTDSPAGAVPVPGRRRTDGTVLVVEDDATVRAMEAMVLEAAGYQVLQARDGIEGLEVAAGHTGDIAIVVTDVLMPRLSGPDLGHRLLAVQPNIKILFTSGYTEAALNGSRVGAPAAFLAKPFTASQLLATVSEMRAGDSAGAEDVLVQNAHLPALER